MEDAGPQLDDGIERRRQRPGPIRPVGPLAEGGQGEEVGAGRHGQTGGAGSTGQQQDLHCRVGGGQGRSDGQVATDMAQALAVVGVQGDASMPTVVLGDHYLPPEVKGE